VARIIQAVHRFFAPTLDPGDETVSLPRDEGEHLVRVLRLSAGDTVSVFDGRGHEFLARVASLAPRDVRLQLLSRVNVPPEAVVPITLVQAVLKGDKMDEIVRDAVMLGVTAIQPLVCRRAETTVAALVRGARLDRWRRLALASAKQSGRAVVPEILTPLAFDTCLDEPPAALRLMLVEPSADAVTEPIGVLRDGHPPADASVWIGPEGGWDPVECAAGRRRGLRLVSLGRHTLRADAVPVAVLSVLRFLWD
jgi:16S rRNA (uracil1498-N3)-methyltransferase